MKKVDIGLIGLAVMGENLVMNIESKGITVAIYNRTTKKWIISHRRLRCLKEYYRLPQFKGTDG